MRKLAMLLAHVLLLALIIGGSGCGGEGTPTATPTPTPASDEKITFPDANLEAAVRDALGKPTGDISRSDLEGLTFLFAEGRGIVDLSGLEYCASLNRLYLWENRIVDISPLSNLSSLEGLYLRDNQISDISPLSNLTRLSSIDLGENRITDISALVENSGLDSGDTVDLRDNPLSTASADVYIPQLEQREVKVLWTWPPTSYGIHVTSSAPGAGGVHISYSGNYTGTGETPFDIGPETSPFTVTLQAPFGLEPLCLCCPCWSVDGSEPACYHDITVAVDAAHRERAVVVSYMLYSPLPCRFHGTVQVDGADVPDGTVITTTVQGDTYISTYSTTTPADFGPSTYALEIWDFSTCHAEGTPIAFMIGDRDADQTATWIAGGDIELNLSASTTATPSLPTPTPTPVPTPIAESDLWWDIQILQFAVDDYLIDSLTAPTADGRLPLPGEYALIDFGASFTQEGETFTFYPDYIKKLPKHHAEGVWRIDSRASVSLDMDPEEY